MNRMYPLSLLLALTCVTPALEGCGKTYTRGVEDPSIDNDAMSTGLDKRDVQKMLKENLNHLPNAPLMNKWRSQKGSAKVAVFPIANSTSEHIDSQMDGLLGETESWLIDSQVVTVIDQQRQKQLIAEVEGQQDAAFNPAHAARYGRQMGVQYYITGKISASDERTDDARRVQYTFFMQVIEVETGAIRFQHKSYVTKLAE